MKTDIKTLSGRFAVPALLALAGLLLMITAAGCGLETEKANALVGEVNTISQNVEPKFTEVEKLLNDASVQLSAGQVAAEQASLTKAQQLLDEIIPEINAAKQKTDEAAALNISEAYRSYLQAKSRGLDASLALTQTSRELTTIFLADLTLEKPDTLTRISELQTRIETQITELNDAEAEATRIASENAGEIEQ